MKSMKRCRGCGKDFLVHACLIERKKFCSRACQFPNPKPKTVPKYRKRHRLELEGQRFTRWLVLSKEAPDARGGSMWRCRCDCGNEVVVDGHNLTQGLTRSCGCLRREVSTANATKHGEGKYADRTTEYETWVGMIRRCEDEDRKEFAHYGGRGVTVCQRWRHDYAAFLADMGRRPDDKTSIDRIETNGNYSCGKCDECAERGWTMNCRWATQTEQMRNTCVNKVVEWNGERMTVPEWSEKTGIKYATLLYRINSGWSVERAMTATARHWPLQMRD